MSRAHHLAHALLPLLLVACAAPTREAPLDALEPDLRAGVDAASSLPRRATHRASGVVLRLVPATATEPAFDLAETELTVASWRRFVDAGGYRSDAERCVPDDRFTVGAFSAVASGNREGSEEASWQRICPLLGTEALRDDLPALYRSGADAEAYAAHYGLRLPTAAEWERAARAGAATRFAWGDDPAGARAFANLQDRAGARRFPDFNVPLACDDGFALVAPVASKQPNSLGFFDLVGNVEECCVAEGRSLDEDEPRNALTGGSSVSDAEGAAPTHRASLARHSQRDFLGWQPALSIATLASAQPLRAFAPAPRSSWCNG
ncbi:MAG: SUMF1/EgtB/PvdO family nonheme iron enzyme [Planctomycetes bacterium]|nr:SUMF1/EgtB/PvdO family nonheme iron enzyme [Planctomycetota bacterium]